MSILFTFILCLTMFCWLFTNAQILENEAGNVIVAVDSTTLITSYAAVSTVISIDATISTSDAAVSTNAATSPQFIVPTNYAVSTDTPVSIFSTPDPSQCSLFFSTLNVYYFPTAAPNTACLPASVSTEALPSGYTNFQSPSIYIIVPTISANNSAGQVGGIYTSVTMSYYEGQLSTIELLPSSTTKPFNLADLPCPDWWLSDPSYNSQQPYQPTLSAPPGIFVIDPAWSNCVTADNQGIDPPRALPTAPNLSPPNPGHGPPRKHKRGPTHAQRVSQGPIETGSPS